MFKRYHCGVFSLFMCIVLGTMDLQAHPTWVSGACVPSSVKGLEHDAAFVFKAKVLGFSGSDTTLQVLQVVKGDLKESHVVLRLGKVLGDGLHKERTYIFFAQSTQEPSVIAPLEGKYCGATFFRATDDDARGFSAAESLVWRELVLLTRRVEIDDVAYAIGQLDRLSRPPPVQPRKAIGQPAFSRVSPPPLDPDFDRQRSLSVIVPFVIHKDRRAASAALQALGAGSPYQDDIMIQCWLAGQKDSLGKGAEPLHRPLHNEEGKRYASRLIRAADNTDTEAEVRTLAIRALGRSSAAGAARFLHRWLSDPQPDVRAAATLLIADYPGFAVQLSTITKDSSPHVRKAVAQAVGCGRFVGRLPLLSRLLHDADAAVREAAKTSILSFPLTTVQGVLLTHLRHPDYGITFTNLLAHDHPERYRTHLLEIVASTEATPSRARPVMGNSTTGWRGLGLPQQGIATDYQESWDLLSGWLDARPVEEVKDIERYFDAVVSLISI